MVEFTMQKKSLHQNIMEKGDIAYGIRALNNL